MNYALYLGKPTDFRFYGPAWENFLAIQASCSSWIWVAAQDKKVREYFESSCPVIKETLIKTTSLITWEFSLHNPTSWDLIRRAQYSIEPADGMIENLEFFQGSSNRTGSVEVLDDVGFAMFWDFDLSLADGRIEIQADVRNDLANWRSELSEHCDSDNWVFVRLSPNESPCDPTDQEKSQL